MKSIVISVRVVILFFWALEIGHPLFAQVPFDSLMAKQVESDVTHLMERARVPGASVAIVQDGRIAYEHGFGAREKGKPDRVTAKTLMMIGSTGKSMTTMMMASLVDQGKIHWDTHAVEIYPGFAVSNPALTQKITLRDLVCNCTGIQRHDLEMQFTNRPRTPEAVIRSLETFGFTGTFGQTFGYVNQMVAAGGYIAAWAAHEPGQTLYDTYVAEMQRRIFDAIGMQSTTFSFERVRSSRDYAKPHGQTGGGDYVPIPLSMERILEPFAPAGASWSNAQDAAEYLITQLSQGIAPNGKRVVSAENLNETWKPEVEIQPGVQYGLGWIIGNYQGRRVLSHAGGTGGFTSELTFMPDAGLGIVILTNAQNADLFAVSVRSRILSLFFGQPADARYATRLDEARKQFDDQRVSLRLLDRRAAAAYLGRYDNQSLGAITLKFNAAGKLIMKIPDLPSELRPLDNESYVVWDPPLAGAQIQFSRNADGKLAFTLDAKSLDIPDKYNFVRSK